MSNNEEKIKAFFNDEEKVKALVNDKEFIEKVSGGTATPKTYKETLGKLGLELNDNECKEVKDNVSKILAIPVEKLEEAKLDNISGGLSISTKERMFNGGILTMPVGIVGGAACSIASAVYSSKAHKAVQRGDTKNSEKYAKITKGLTIAAASFGGIGIASVALAATGLYAPRT